MSSRASPTSLELPVPRLRRIRRTLVAAIALLLGDRLETVRVEAAYALGRLRDPRGLPALVKLTTHRDFGYMVCELLGRLGDPEAVAKAAAAVAAQGKAKG